MNEATVDCFEAIVSMCFLCFELQGNANSSKWAGGMSMVRSVRGERGRYGVVLPEAPGSWKSRPATKSTSTLIWQ